MPLMKKTSFISCILVSALMAFGILSVSCKSTPVEVPYDASELEIIQLAQTAYDSGDQKLAVEYYSMLITRFGMDTATYIEGRYEIAHIYVKQKKYDLAAPMLEEIIAIYESSAPGTLPGAYRKLALSDYQKIPEDKRQSSK